MTPFTIANGILRIHGKRILLSRVTSYDEAQQTVVICHGNRQDSLNMGSDAPKLAAALDAWFSIPPKLRELPPDHMAELKAGNLPIAPYP